MTSPGPSGLTRQTAARTDSPSDLRSGVISAVTNQGVEVDVASGTITAAHLSSYAPAVGDPVALERVNDMWLVLGRPIGPGTETTLFTPGPMMGNILDGMITTGTDATLATSTGTTQDVARLTVSFYHPPGHVVEVRVNLSWYGTTSSDWIIADLVETGSGVKFGEMLEPEVSGSSLVRDSELVGYLSPSFGGVARHVKVTMSRFTGAGTVNILHVSTRPTCMVARDIGDSSMIRLV